MSESMNRNEKLVASRWIPAGAVKVASKKSSAIAYLYEAKANGAVYGMGYIGNAGKPAFHYRFKDAARRAQYVAEWIKEQDEAAARKAERLAAKRAAAKQPHKLKVGDVLMSVWGYDQTNIDYYEVVSLVGERMVDIREIAAESVDTGFMQGQCVPVKGKYVGEVMRKRVSDYDGQSVRIASYASASKIEPVKVAGIEAGYAPSRWTAYA